MKRKKKETKKSKLGKSFSAGKAGLAFKHEFYLETIWILSMMFEKKAKSLLKKIEPIRRVQGYSLEQSIKRIKYHQMAGKVFGAGEHMTTGLLDSMQLWKNTRNTMLKDMVSVHVSKSRMERLASEGIALYKNWNKAIKLVKTELINSAGVDEKQQ